MNIFEQSSEYHKRTPKGKLTINSTKPLENKLDLSLAYTPGVAGPCLEIEKDSDLSYEYTNRGNLVAVISNGSAVLGLGNIGALASKPVMEGKSVLFKKFSGIDSIDIEINESDPLKLVSIIESLKYSFGGINLEDIKAPDCFIIENALKSKLDIPVMHDDQHGTAIIVAAALLNALELSHKSIQNIKCVINGAGSGAVAIANLLISLGLKFVNLTMLDTKGVIHDQRNDLADHKKKFLSPFNNKIQNLEDAIKDTDVFIGVSVANVLTANMIKTMSKNAIVFALANPDPEIPYNEAINSRKDIILATGRSDYPNQVNNILGFPFIFRAALDVRAKSINEPMKIALVRSLADLAKEEVPKVVKEAYNEPNIVYGKNYILPKPFDPRLITSLVPPIAKAAMESNVAKKPIDDWDMYKNYLQNISKQ